VASQLRLRVVLPVAVLGVLGLGVGAFATTRNAPDDLGAIPPATTQSATTRPKQQKQQKPKQQKSKQQKPKLSPLEAALRKHNVVVVLFYAPGDDYDTIQTRETRAGALAANAGFLAVDVTRNKKVAELAAKYGVLDAPATVVFKRGPRAVFRVAGYMDRFAIAQAAASARR
jgi:thiol:disulfide interchange protein